MQDAAAINEWRFSKLKEYKDRNIEVENEAFDRYMQNISLLEEVFSVDSILEGRIEEESSVSNPNRTSIEVNPKMMVSGLKLRLRSTSIRTDNSRKRIQQIVDQGLKKLQKSELEDGVKEPSDPDEHNEGPKKAKFGKTERALAMSDLIDKLNKARNEEDLKSCWEMKFQIFNQDKISNETEINDAAAKDHIPDIDSAEPKECSLKTLITTTEVDQETLNRIDAHFAALEQIEDL